MKAPATFSGWQFWPGRQPIALYNLVEDIADHPKGSTVSAFTLLTAGYAVPAPPEEIPMAQVRSHLYPSARFHPSHATVRCNHCGSPLLVRMPEYDAGAALPLPSRFRQFIRWVGRNIEAIFAIALIAAMLLFVLGGFVWVGPR